MKKFTELLIEKYGQLGGIILIVVALMIYILIPLHPQVTSEHKEVVIHFADNISGAHQKLIDRFNEKYKGEIRVETIDLPFNKFSTNERKELLTRTLRSKSKRIDVFSVDQIWVKRFAKWCEPLGKYFDINERAKFLKYPYESCLDEKELMAIPLYLDISVMYYRKDILKKLPTFDEIKTKLDSSITWEDFIELKMKLSEYNDNPFYIFQAANYEGLICSYFELLLNQDRKYFGEDNIRFNTPEGKKALSLLVDLVNKYNLTPKIVTDFKEHMSYDYFIKNNGVFLRGWPSFDSDYKSLIRDSLIEKKLRKVPLPHFEGSKPSMVFGGWNLMISKFSDNKPGVIKFIKFLVEENSQKTLYEVGSYFPVIKSLYNDEKFHKRNPGFTDRAKLLKYGVHRPFREDYTKISDVVSYFVRKAMLKEIGIEEALAKIDEYIKSSKTLIK